MMNQEQKEKIRALRRRGMSYKEISDVCHLAKSTVSTFCKKENLNGIGANEAAASGICKQCGNPKTKKQQKFCSESCRRAWWKHPFAAKRKAIYPFTCACCGEDFTAYGNAHRKYCSHACYIKARFGERNGK